MRVKGAAGAESFARFKNRLKPRTYSLQLYLMVTSALAVSVRDVIATMW